MLESQKKIIKAATQEFVDRGVAGTRMEGVSKRAGVNKSLVYRYFKDKRTLFGAVFEHHIERRWTLRAKREESIDRHLVSQSMAVLADPIFTKLHAQEGVVDTGEETPISETRRKFIDYQGDMVRAFQEAGALDPRFDTPSLQFLLLSLTMGPVVLPQILRLVVPGEDRTDRWLRFLEAFSPMLAEAPDPQDGPVPVVRPIRTPPGESTDTRTRILDAAVNEFVHRGLAGTRMEAVANDSGRNKSLVYRYFKNKPGLFGAVIAREVERTVEIIGEMPDDLGSELVAWSRAIHADPIFTQLHLQEGVVDDGSPPVMAEERKAFYAARTARIRQQQQRGAIDPALDPEVLQFAFISMIVGAVLYPQMFRLIVGPEQSIPRWETTLRRMAIALRPV